MSCMKKKKELTKTQHMENNATVLNLVARLIVCGFLLAQNDPASDFGVLLIIFYQYPIKT